MIFVISFLITTGYLYRKNNFLEMKTNDLLEAQGIQSHFCTTSIFQEFNELSIGEEMALNFDHEPVDLYTQFEEKFHDQYTWHNVEKGPEIWFISIIKLGKDLATVGDVLCENPKAFTVLRKYNIDACCKGNILFADACKEAGVSVKKVMKEIEAVENNADVNIRVSEWPLDFLIDYIVMNHHRFVKEKATVISGLLRDLQNEEEGINPLVFQINLVFINVHNALKKHVKDEEDIIFPAIKELLRNGLPPQDLPFDTLQETIFKLQKEDREINTGMAHIRKMVKNHVKHDVKGKMGLLYKELEEYEKDLYYHLHLENNILFPKAVFLEEEANIWND